MNVIYIAGSYRASTVRGIVENIRAAEAVGIELLRAGYMPIIPHMNTALWDGIVPDEVFLRGTLAILERCDLVVMMPGWENSVGATNEAKHAEAIGIPVECWPSHDATPEYMAELFRIFDAAIEDGRRVRAPLSRPASAGEVR